MARILTFLGKGGSGCTTMAIASAKKLALNGNRVLLVGQDPGPVLGLLLGVTLTSQPQEIAANLKVVQLQTTVLLEKNWEELKTLEKQYLRSPILKNVYGQELSILPGIDQALALNAIREYDQSGNYDVIVYDGSNGVSTLRMFGIPETLSWYVRRFRQVVVDSDFGKALSPFIAPVSTAILNVSWNPDNFGKEPTNKTNQILDDGKAALADPKRVAAYLVISNDSKAIATAKYLWGHAQQVNLTVAGVLLNQTPVTETLEQEFTPLTLSCIPTITSDDWQIVIDALPNLETPANTPKPLIIDIATGEVRVFLPGFDKKEVKLTQSGPEITIEAGDQRRNIMVPPSLAGKPVKGAKFQNSYLIISF